jgi:hypothetical protein
VARPPARSAGRPSRKERRVPAIDRCGAGAGGGRHARLQRDLHADRAFDSGPRAGTPHRARSDADTVAGGHPDAACDADSSTGRDTDASGHAGSDAHAPGAASDRHAASHDRASAQSDAAADCDPGAHGGADSAADGGSHASAHPHRGADAGPHGGTDPVSHAHDGPHRHPCSYTITDTHRKPDRVADGDANGNRGTHADRHRNAHPEPHRRANPDANRDADGDPHADAEWRRAAVYSAAVPDSHGNADTRPVAATAKRGRLVRCRPSWKLSLRVGRGSRRGGPCR